MVGTKIGSITKGITLTKKEYIALHAEYCERMKDITARKNHDYTGNSEDPFNNFKTVELSGICSTEQGFLVRLTDKFSRIASFVKQGVLQVKDESIEDTLLDAANYCLLMAAYIKAKKQEAAPNSFMGMPVTVDDRLPAGSFKIQQPTPGQFLKRTGVNWSEDDLLPAHNEEYAEIKLKSNKGQNNE